jgi:hypothetical protein
MNCGAELYPTQSKRTSPNIDKSYLALWAVMGALIVGLFWVATRNSDNRPEIVAADSLPKENIVNDGVRIAPARNEMTPAKRAELESDAKNALSHYASAVSDGKKSVAISYWKNPTSKVSKQLDSLVSIEIISSKSMLKSERSAETWVDWIVSSTSKSGEHWRGTILQEKPGETWVIASMKGMKCIDGCGGAFPPPRAQKMPTTGPAFRMLLALTMKRSVTTMGQPLGQSGKPHPSCLAACSEKLISPRLIAWMIQSSMEPKRACGSI